MNYPGLFASIDKMISQFDALNTFPAFHCPEAQRKSYYLKCCHLLFVHQRIKRVSPSMPDIDKSIKLLKEWMPLLREAGL